MIFLLLFICPKREALIQNTNRNFTGNRSTHPRLLFRPCNHHLLLRRRQRNLNRLGMGAFHHGRNLHRRRNIRCSSQPRHFHHALHIPRFPIKKILSSISYTPQRQSRTQISSRIKSRSSLITKSHTQHRNNQT